MLTNFSAKDQYESFTKPQLFIAFLLQFARIVLMKTIGIIMECNPFHNGHEYILTAAKKQFGADHIIVVSSGDHVQRGEPAIMDKYARTACILQAGADLVLELPVPFATGSAQYFARGAVATLLHTGAVDSLLFGSECGDISMLRSISETSSESVPAVSEDPPAGRPHTGNHTPLAERTAPNDLLAAEYLKALRHFGSGLPSYTITRKGSGYHETALTGTNASASALRTRLLADPSLWSICAAHMPSYAYAALHAYAKDHRFLRPDAYSDLLFYALLQKRCEGYDRYFDVFEDLSNKISSGIGEFKDVSSFTASLKSKDIAYSHISRALLHILLGITKEQVAVLTEQYDLCPYLRILGLRKDASDLMHSVKVQSDRPVLSKLADARTVLEEDALFLLEQDIFASELYAKTAFKNGGFVSEYRRGLILI